MNKLFTHNYQALGPTMTLLLLLLLLLASSVPSIFGVDEKHDSELGTKCECLDIHFYLYFALKLNDYLNINNNFVTDTPNPITFFKL